MKNKIILLPNVAFIIGILVIVAICFLINSQIDRELQIISSIIIPIFMLIISFFVPDLPGLKSRTIIRAVFISFSFFLSLDYLYWRGEETLPTKIGILPLILGGLLFLAECHCFLYNAISYLISYRRTNRKPIPLPSDFDLLPSVDIYIPTYNEDPHIVCPTVIAATQINYPKDKLNVYLLDDGGTIEKCTSTDSSTAKVAIRRAGVLKAICTQFGATYITRDRNENAKAGNINAALNKTHGELLVILDCDHIPTKEFLQKTVGFFIQDPNLFLVQTPHYFINPDPLERNLAINMDSPSENDLFYRSTQPGLDANGSTFFCGSAGVLRRRVLNEIGGIATKTIVEDAETTLVAFNHGYRSAYLNEVLVSGLQPETFSGFIQQRIRWSQGMLQIFMLKNPWLLPSLTLSQRFIFSYFAIFWGFPLSRLIMMLAPSVTLIFSIPIVHAKVSDILIHAAPALITSAIVSQYLYGRIRWPFISHLYEIIQSVHLSRGIAKVLLNPLSPSFVVTPKGEVLIENFISSLTKPFYFFLILNLVASIFAVNRFINEPLNQDMILLVGVWSTIDVLMFLCVLGITHEKKQLRTEPRAEVQNPIWLRIPDETSIRGIMVDASTSGAKIRFRCSREDFSKLTNNQEIILDIPDRFIQIKCSIQSAQLEKNNFGLIGIAYQLNSTRDERIAVDIAFGSCDQIKNAINRRHVTKNHFQSMLNIIRFAFDPGVGHLRFLTSNLYKKLIRFLNLKIRRKNV
jgi:cellulose synthase (UDP-forming)